MTVSSNQFKNGMTIEIDGEIYEILEFMHVKPGKGQAFVRTKLKNVMSGSVVQKTFRADEKVETAHIERKEMEFLYSNGERYNFMDNRTYEQILLHEDDLGKVKDYLKENMVCEVLFYRDKPFRVEPPDFVELEIVETEPGLKGDTQSGGTKPATLETGIVIQVPLFVKKDDKVKVDTRTGEYVTRV